MKRIHLAVVTALVLAACGGSAADTTTSTDANAATTAAVAVTTTTTASPATTVAETTTTTDADREAVGGSDLRRIQLAMAQSSQVESARMSGEIRIIGSPEFEGEFAISFAGAFDHTTGDSSFSIDMSSLADLIDMGTETEAAPDDPFGSMFADLFLGMFTKFEVRQIGDTVYMNNPFFVSLSGAETEWVATPADGNTSMTGGFIGASPGDPSELLGAYGDADGKVEDLGTELVNGVETTHYRITYNTEDLLEGATDDERAALEESGALYGKTLDLDVWVTDEFVHKFVMDVDGSELDLPPDEQFDRMVFTYEISEYGEDVSIEAPPADQVTVIDADSLGMGFDFSG